MTTRILMAFIVLHVTASFAHAQINFLNVSGGVLGDRVALNTVGVQRGVDNFLYDYSDLLIPTLADTNIPSPGTRSILLYADPLDTQRDQALSDPFLNTGFLDFGEGNGSFAAGAEMIRLDFADPVVNDVGPDIIMAGIGFQFFIPVRPFYLSFDGIASFEISGTSEFEGPTVDSIPYYAFPGGITAPSELVTEPPQNTGGLGNSTAIPRPQFITIDLSNLGIAPGESISSIYMQDKVNDSRDFYPVFVAGLPPLVDLTDSDGDGVLDSEDVCPNNSPNLDVDCDGRPKLDTNGDCLVNGADIQSIVDQIIGQ